jgi:predicted short-subunit dehydrogenase-like oxidoreductase (DUF2520 family)
VTDHRPKQAWVVYGLLKLPYRRMRSTEVAAASDVVFLTTPDRVIEAEFAAIRRWLIPGTIVAHCSGSLGADVFKGAREQGLGTLALHPVQSFTSHAQAIRALPGSFFAIEGSPTGVRFGRDLVRRLHGHCVVVTGRERPLYHAMCVFASNLLNAVLDGAETVASRMGIPRRRAARMFAPLARTVLEAAVESGAGPALTGPVRRGDWETVRRHMSALAREAPELVPMYRILSLRLLKLARGQGLDDAGARRVRAALEGTRC